MHIPADGVKIPAAAQSLGSELVSVEMFIKPCSFKQGGGGGGSDERRRKASELRAELGERSEDPTSRIRRRKVSEELSRHRSSEEQARNRRRKASELREEFARRAKDRNGRQDQRSGEKSQERRQDQRSSREKSQEVLTSSPPSPCLYRVLGLDNQANNKEIRKAFLGKVLKRHRNKILRFCFFVLSVMSILSLMIRLVMMQNQGARVPPRSTHGGRVGRAGEDGGEDEGGSKSLRSPKANYSVNSL